MNQDKEGADHDPAAAASLSDRAAAREARAFALRHGLAFSEQPLRPASGLAFQHAIAAGIAPLDETGRYRLALAPGPAESGALAQHDLSDRPDIVVMPRPTFRRMLRRHAREQIVHHASHHLAEIRPDLSARAGLNLRQALALAALAMALLASAQLSGTAAFLLLAFFTTPVFTSLLVLRLGAMIDAWTPAAAPATPLPDAELPLYTLLVPLYREAAVLDRLIEALLGLDYPADKLDIKIIVEECDGQTREALAARLLPAHIDVLVAPDGLPRTKPRALNIGLIEARGELLAIFDAEDRPDPRQLRVAANLFRRLPRRVACLQGRLVIENVDDSWLTRFFALEYAALFDVVNSGLMRSGLPVLLGGTSNHFRTRVLRAVGGWDAWNVTEDADLAFRLIRSGYRMADLPSATYEEAPPALRPWFSQRVRWMKGFMQTLITHTRTPLRFLHEAGAPQGLTLASLCAGTLLSVLSYPLFIIGFALSYLTHGAAWPDTTIEAVATGIWVTLLAGGLVALVAPAIVGVRHRGLTDLLWCTPLMPLYCLLISAAAWSALAEYVRAPTRWNKTEHGLARSSRYRRQAPSEEAPS